MIDLTTGLSSDIKQPRRGLLIDLDMAKDEGGELEDLSKRGPERTVSNFFRCYDISVS